MYCSMSWENRELCIKNGYDTYTNAHAVYTTHTHHGKEWDSSGGVIVNGNEVDQEDSATDEGGE